MLHRNLPVFSGIAYILRRRALNVREPLAQRGDNVARLIQAERGLRQVRDPVRVGQRHRRHFRRRPDYLCHRRCLAQRANHFVMIAMANQNQRIAFLGELHRLHMHLGDQRTRSIDHPQLPQFAVLAHFRRNAVGAVDDALALRHFIHAIDKDRALLLQFLDHEAVVDNFLAHINRPPKGLQRNPDNIDRAHHPSAEPPRLQ